MESKNIRFEKGEDYMKGQILFYQEVEKYFVPSGYDHFTHRCVKSFTVQINIIEDEHTDS